MIGICILLMIIFFLIGLSSSENESAAWAMGVMCGLLLAIIVKLIL